MRPVMVRALVIAIGLSLVVSAYGGGPTTTPSAASGATSHAAVTPTQAPKPEQPNVSFVFSFGHSGHRSPYWLAKEKGFFQAEGLDVKMNPGTNSTNALEQLATNQVHFSELEFANVILGVSKGRDVKTVMTVLQRSPQCIVSFVDSGIMKPKDLEGKSLVVDPGAADARVLPALWKRNDVDASKIKFISATAATQTNIFLSRQASARPTFANDSFIRFQRQGHKVQCFLYADHGVALVGNGLAVNGTFLKNNPNTVAAFVRAAQKAFLYAEQHPEQSIDALLKVADLLKKDDELEILKATWPFTKSNNTAKNGFGFTSPEDAQRSADLLQEVGLITAAGNASQYFDNSFLPRR